MNKQDIIGMSAVIGVVAVLMGAVMIVGGKALEQ